VLVDFDQVGFGTGRKLEFSLGDLRRAAVPSPGRR
jgi:hypothetical protein